MNKNELINFLKERSTVETADSKLDDCCKLFCGGMKEKYLELVKHLTGLLNLKFVFVKDEDETGIDWEDGSLINYVQDVEDNHDMLPVFIAKALDCLEQNPDMLLHKTFKFEGETLEDAIKKDFALSGFDKEPMDREDKYEILSDMMPPLMYFQKYSSKGSNKTIINSYPNTCKFMEHMTSHSLDKLVELYSKDESKAEDLKYIQDHKQEFICFTEE